MGSVVELRVRQCAMLLTGILLLQLAWSLAQWITMGSPEPVLPAPASVSVSGIDRSALVEDPNTGENMVSKPLFWAGREPYVVPEGMEEFEVPVTGSRRTSIDKAKLLGVYSTANSRGVILAHQGQRMRLNLNDSIDGWTLTLLSADGAIFENGDESRTIGLEHALTAAPKNARAVKREESGGAVPEPREPKTNKTGS